LEAASPGHGKDIACALARKASEEMIRMVEKSLRKVSIWSRRRKKCVVKKSSAASGVMSLLWDLCYLDLLCVVLLKVL
jgi:hypothetical protein